MMVSAKYKKTSTITFLLTLALFAFMSCSKKDGSAPTSVPLSEVTRVQAASTLMGVASASKLLFASYVIEKKKGILTANDIKHLKFTSGYSTFTSCSGYSTVGSCYSAVTAYVPADDGKFYYSGGHFQKFASVDLSLSALNSSALSAELNTYLGSDVAVTFSVPQPAGGIVFTPTNYAVFLRKILNQQLKIFNFLGTNSICTNTNSCASSSNSTPIPTAETWYYSLGHWIENDPVQGDGSFSSPGLFGFYPWISADKTRYGILARYDTVSANAAFDSVNCGRLIRKAYTTGTVQ